MSDNNDNRIDQLLRIDTNALLTTIRDLEHRLTEHQRQDKLPAWAQSLEQRLEQIEKWQSNVGNSTGYRTDNRSSSPQRYGNAESKANEVAPTLDELALEERILNATRQEVENKVANVHMHYDSILSGYSLEVDRLHKLLQIRPTNSEVQQILVNISTMEEQTNQKLNTIQHSLLASISNRLSDEMVILFEELKANRTQVEEKYSLTDKQFTGVYQKVNEVRESAQQTINNLEIIISKQAGQIEQLLSQNEGKTNELTQIMQGNETAIQSLQTLIQQNHTKVEAFQESEALKWVQQEVAMKEKIKSLEKQYLLFKEMLNNNEYQNQDLNQDYNEMKINMKNELGYLKAMLQEHGTQISHATENRKTMQTELDEIRKFEIEDHFFRYNEGINKNGHEIKELQHYIQSNVIQEIKAINMKVNTINDIVTISLPRQLQEGNDKLQHLTESITKHYEAFEKVKRKLQLTDELIDSTLMMLPEKVNNIMQKLTIQQDEILAMKRSMELNVDAHSEMIRRIEELEETIENVDDLINTRMNSIRDTLMEIFLEKQYETNQVIKNVKENLDVIASTGDGPTPPTVMAKLTRISTAHKTNFDLDVPHTNSSNGNVGVPPTLRGSSMARIPDLKKLNSFKIPTLDNAMIMGNNPTGNSNGNSHSNGTTNGNSNGTTPTNHKATTKPSKHEDTNSAMTRSTPRDSIITSSNETNMLPASHSVSVHTTPRTTPTINTEELKVDTNILANNKHLAHMLPGISESSTPTTHSPLLSGRLQGSSTPLQAPFYPTNTTTNGSGNGSNKQFDDDVVMLHEDDNGNDSYKSVVQEPIPLPTPSHSPPTTTHHHNTTSLLKPHVISSSQNQPVAQHQQQQQQIIPSVHPQRQDMLAVEYAALLGIPSTSSASEPSQQHNSNGGGMKSTLLSLEIITNPHYFSPDNHNIQFLADLCINYEEISYKKKAIQQIPPVLCQHLLFITSQVAEQIAMISDYEMVAHMIMKVSGLMMMSEIVYDESYLLQRRDEKMSLVLGSLQVIVNAIYHTNGNASGTNGNGSISSASMPGIIRYEARQLFFSLVKKALDMFLTKHNQVLIVGNSRLGRVKIPTCIACDRPLVEKTRLENTVGSPNRPRTATASGLDPSNSVMSVRSIPNTPSIGGHNAWITNEEEGSVIFPEVSRNTTASRPRTSHSTKSSHSNSNSNSNSNQPYVLKAGFKMPVNTRPNSSSTSSLPRMHNNNNNL